MGLGWVQLSNPVAVWWLSLSAVSVFNLGVWVWSHRRLSALGRLGPVLWLGLLYVAGCASRSFIPRADVQRICLWDTWWSTVLVGRTVATVAELAFVAQGALVLGALGRALDAGAARAVSRVMVPLIAVAECCSWYAVITTNYAGNMCEESLWGITYALAAVGVASLALKTQGRVATALWATVAGCAAYVAFMGLVDVPMYVGRWREDLAAGRAFLGFADGFHDLNTRWVVTHDIQDWRTEIPWMSLYFSFAVWVSLFLCHIPMEPDRIRAWLLPESQGARA
jgi:hypothetical protein